MILIVSTIEDGHTAAVRAELARAGVQSRVLDLRDFPTKLELSLHYSTGDDEPRRLRCREGCDVDLRSVSAIWWRRPQVFSLDERLVRPSYRAFAYNECHEAWAGLWQTLDVMWVNDPTRDEAASRKAYQLDVARSAGLAVPRTLITNDPSEARSFISAQPGRTIYKAFSATEQEWRETRLLREEDLRLLDRVRHAPLIFQEYIAAGVDVRVTIVGGEMFAAAIESADTSYPFDFRVDMNAARVRPYALSSALQRGLSALMSALWLQYGAVDLREQPNGEVVFLEINPAGQWLFIEERTRQPITAAVARLLATPRAQSQSAASPSRTLTSVLQP